MHRAQALLMLAALHAAAAGFSGVTAMEHARKVTAFGPRPPQSAAHKKLQGYIIAELKKTGCQVLEDPFTARTPKGPMAMNNILCRFAGSSGRMIVFSGHYDTKLFPGMNFVGANDGGSSTGLLLALAQSLAGMPRKDDVWLVFFDGEEAIGEWSATDGIHGSRHLAEKWGKDGTLRRIRALINVDMIGDANLGILPEAGSNQRLLRLVWAAARDLGYGRFFLDEPGALEDDHMPFVRAGVPALDLIDFDYPHWHTSQDTIDKISPRSLQVVGDVLLETLKRLEN